MSTETISLTPSSMALAPQAEPDPFFATAQSDRRALAYFSGNPSFLKGIVGDVIPITADNSMLAVTEPEAGSITGAAIAEAMEAAYVYAPVPAVETRKRQRGLGNNPLDTELAISGLTWLIPQFRKGTPLRRAASRANRALSDIQTIDSMRHRLAVSYSAAYARLSRQEDNSASHQPDSIERQAQQALEAGRQSLYLNRFASVMELVRDETPDVNTEPLLEIAQSLNLYELSDGSLTAQPKTDFTAYVSRRVRQYFNNPDTLVNDCRIAAIIHTYGLPEEISLFEAYHSKIEEARAERLRNSAYTTSEFSPEVVAKWVGFRSILPATITGEKYNEHVHDKDDPDVLTHAMIDYLRREIFSTSLIGIAVNRPRDFVSKLYMFAEAGLDPTDELTYQTTMDTIVTTFKKQPQTGYLLSLGMAMQDEQVRQKTCDLYSILEAFSVPREFTGTPRLRHHALPHAKREKLKRICGPFIGGGQVQNKMVAARKNRELLTAQADHFRNFALNTAEGRATTIFGRFSEVFPRED